MIYCENGDSSSMVVDLADDAEVTATGAVLAFELEPKRVPDTVWVLGEPAVHELDNCGCDLLR